MIHLSCAGSTRLKFARRGYAARCAERLCLSDCVSFLSLYTLARLSLANVNCSEWAFPEGHRLSAHHAAEPRRVANEKRRQVAALQITSSTSAGGAAYL
jgi:hypothetical protein